MSVNQLVSRSILILTMLLAFTLTLRSTCSLASSIYVNVIHVVDADTLDIEIPGYTEGWNEHRIRLDGLNAPESRSRCETDQERVTEREMAARAEDYVQYRIWDAEVIEVERKGQDSFNRVLAVLYIDGRSLNADLLEEGWALPYRPDTHGLQFCGDAQKGAYPAE